MGFVFKIKHSQTRSFQTKTLISWKVLGPLLVAQDFVYSMCHDRHISPANAAAKITGYPGCVCWPSHKETAQLMRPHTFFILYDRFERTLLRSSLPSVSSPLVSVVPNVWGTTRDELCSMCSTRPKTSSNPVNNQANDEDTPRYICGRYGDKTYSSSRAPVFVPCQHYELMHKYDSP